MGQFQMNLKETIQEGSQGSRDQPMMGEWARLFVGMGLASFGFADVNCASSGCAGVGCAGAHCTGVGCAGSGCNIFAFVGAPNPFLRARC